MLHRWSLLYGANIQLMDLQRRHTWGVNDGQVGAKLVFNLDYNFSLPELMFSLQSCISHFQCTPASMDKAHTLKLCPYTQNSACCGSQTCSCKLTIKFFSVADVFNDRESWQEMLLCLANEGLYNDRAIASNAGWQINGPQNWYTSAWPLLCNLILLHQIFFAELLCLFSMTNSWSSALKDAPAYHPLLRMADS